MASVDAYKLTIRDLPSVVVSQILSYLMWEDKLHVVRAIPQWRDSLHSTTAWQYVKYGNEREENRYFWKEKRTKFLVNIKQYGKYIRRIYLSFGHRMGHLGLKILNAVGEFCLNLRVFVIAQETPSQLDSNLLWCKSTVNSVCGIIEQCQLLTSVCINQPVIDWSDSSINNIIVSLIDQNLTGKIVHLELSAESLWEHEGYLEFLKKFTSLKRLVTRREKVNDDILLSLVNMSLEEVTLIQEEEIPLDQQGHLQEKFWDKVLRVRPSFKIDLVLRYIMVIKDSFSSKMPLRSLILDDLVNIVTKGVLEHLVHKYCGTLENFTYGNSLLENFETGDARVPFSLVNLAEKCSKIRVIQFGFPLSSTTILLIARARKLEKLVIPAVEVSYEFDWQPRQDWSPELISWLKENGQSEAKLEKAVSLLQGYRWQLTNDSNLTLSEEFSTLYM